MNQFKRKPYVKTYTHLAIAILIGLAILFGLNPTNGLTREGVTLLAIVAPTIYMWLFINTHWVSLLFLALLAMTGSMTPNQVWSSSLGHFSIMLVLTFSILSESLNETGAIQKIANWFITRKFVQGRPYAFMAMFFASNLVIGMFMQNLALAVMFVALTAQICENLGIKKGDSLYNCFMLGTFWGNGVLSIASPIAKTLPNILIGLVYHNFGIEITYAQWFMVGVPFSIVMFAIIMLCIRIINPKTDTLKKFDVNDIKQHDQPLGRRGIFTLVGMLVLILIILLPELFVLLNIFVGISTYFIRIGPIAPAIIVIITLCLIHVKENNQFVPVMDFSRSAKHVPINLLLFVAAVVIMGVPMSAESSGIIVWMQHLLTPLTHVLSPFVLFSVLIVIAVVLTNFISNTVVLTLFVSLGSALLIHHPIGPVVFSFVVAYAASMTCLTPSATITAPLYYGPEHLKVKEVIRINVLFLLLTTVLLLAMTPLVMVVIG
ncbi:MAG: SLC13 family permease [Defluviitaleaceae bacterium]|nr:SLC13 family permease [Defluviitaleaceae bacterium]